MRRVLKLATAGAAATLLLAACGEAPTEDESNAGGGDNAESSEGGGDSEAASDFKACMVSDAGGFDDQSFNQSGKEGLDAAAEALDVEAVEVESQADTDYATNVAGLVDQGCSITIGPLLRSSPVK